MEQEIKGIETNGNYLYEDIGKMTEETSQKLLNILEEFNKTNDAFYKAHNKWSEAYLKNIQRSCAIKLVDYMYKASSATFLTRWYWLRKARKCNNTLVGIIKLNQSIIKVGELRNLIKKMLSI